MVSQLTRLLLPLLALAMPAAAQIDPAKFEPKRPKLPPGADTNSAAAYYQYGLMTLSRSPDQAAAAFHWAYRLNPGMGEPLYAKRTALLLTARNRLGDYFSGRGYARSKVVRSIDSLAFEARLRNPVLIRSLDLPLFEEWYSYATGEMLHRGDLNEYGPAVSAWLAMSRADYPTAAQNYAKVLKDKRAWGYLYDRALALYYMGQHDSAITHLNQYIQKSREDEKKEKEVVVWYNSSALAEYTIGYLYFVRDMRDSARAAFGRALSEDLSFYMAHASLGDLARASGDSATAIQELELAVQLRPNDAHLRYRLGRALYESRRHADAVSQLEEATRAEPYYALPWYYLGLAAEALDQRDKAIQAYDEFMGRAARDLRAERNVVTQRLAKLRPA
jgi:tetratricopeptide (TPR) repeat protein